MKTIQKILTTGFLATMLVSFWGLTAFGQEVIEVKNIQAQISKGTQPCYVVEIPQADLKTVQQNWIKKLQEGTKINIKEINQELVLAGAVKSELSKDTVNIYSLLFQKDSMVLLNVFLEFDSVFFKPNDDKTDLASEKKDSNIKNYIRSFAVDQYRIAVTDELEAQQKILKTMQNDLEKLEKDAENMQKDNSSLENDIESTKREISEIDQNIDSKRQEILTHNISMQTLVLETDKKAAKDKQNELEKEKKQLEKSRSRAKDDISSYKSKIDKNNNDIGDCVIDQEEKKEEITKQNEVITQVQTKLNGIK